MQQQRKPPQHPQHRKRDETPLSHRVMMAVAAIIILLGMLYVLNGKRFPTDITYRNVAGGGSTYVIQRENPKSW